MALDPDRISGQLVLLFLDKLVLGIAAAVILLWFEGRTERTASLREARQSAARLETQHVQGAIGQVSGVVSAFMALVDSVAEDSDVIPAEAAVIGHRMKRRVDQAVLTATGATDPIIWPNSTEGVRQSLGDAMLEVLRRIHDDPARSVLNEQYRSMLTILRDASINAIEYEWEVAR